MPRLSFTLNNLPAMPRNRSHALMKGRLIKTQLARAFDEDLTERLDAFRESFDFFRRQYDEKNHALKIHVIVQTPRETLFTKKGTISQNSVDADAHKLLFDRISDAIDIDDSAFCRWHVDKVLSPNEFWNFKVTIETFLKEELHGPDSLLH